MKTYSIKRSLSNKISLLVSIVLILVLLAVDISLDWWLNKEFDLALTNKKNVLVTMLKDNRGEISFEFIDELMPEYSHARNAEYFQLWRNNNTFDKSQSLSTEKNYDLPYLKIAASQSSMVNIILPNGDLGRMIFQNFYPHRVNRSSDIDKRNIPQQEMQIAVAKSIKELNRILYIVDIVFLLSCFIAVIASRYIVNRIVTRGLRPLSELNTQLTSFSDTKKLFSSKESTLELEGIINELNKFYFENSLLVKKEKALTSNIAHELKTPISEMYSLLELAILYPDNAELNDNLKEELLAIVSRLKDLVINIMSYHKQDIGLESSKPKTFELKQFIQHIIASYKEHPNRIHFAEDTAKLQAVLVKHRQFLLERILKNLIDNALKYSPEDSHITIHLYERENSVDISICNTLLTPISDNELKHVFDPFWQQGAARNSRDNVGLGLSIVKSYCEMEAIDIALRIENNQFIIILNDVRKA